MGEQQKPNEADLEFFHKWLHDATDAASFKRKEDDTPEGQDKRALRVGSYLLGFYEGATARECPIDHKLLRPGAKCPLLHPGETND